MRGVFHHCVQVHLKERSLLECPGAACGCPVLLDGDENTSVDEAFEVGLAGDTKLLKAAIGKDECLKLEEGDTTADDGEGVALSVMLGVAFGA